VIHRHEHPVHVVRSDRTPRTFHQRLAVLEVRRTQNLTSNRRLNREVAGAIEGPINLGLSVAGSRNGLLDVIACCHILSGRTTQVLADGLRGLQRNCAEARDAAEFLVVCPVDLLRADLDLSGLVTLEQTVLAYQFRNRLIGGYGFAVGRLQLSLQLVSFVLQCRILVARRGRSRR